MDTGISTGHSSLVGRFPITLSSIEPYGYLQLPVKKKKLCEMEVVIFCSLNNYYLINPCMLIG